MCCCLLVCYLLVTIWLGVTVSGRDGVADGLAHAVVQVRYITMSGSALLERVPYSTTFVLAANLNHQYNMDDHLHPSSAMIAQPTAPMNRAIDPSDFSFEVEEVVHHEPGHKNIHVHVLTIKTKVDDAEIGWLRSSLLRKAEMERIGPDQMWIECLSFEDAHGPDARTAKVGAYLANESFSEKGEELIGRATAVLFIEGVWFEKAWRGHGLGLLAIDELIKSLSLPAKCIALLQASQIKRVREDSAPDPQAAFDKIARHWRLFGFDEWSTSYDAWLCLDLSERPAIEQVMKQYHDRRQ